MVRVHDGSRYAGGAGEHGEDQLVEAHALAVGAIEEAAVQRTGQADQDAAGETLVVDGGGISAPCSRAVSIHCLRAAERFRSVSLTVAP